MKNFLEKQKKVCSSKKNFGASSAPTRPIMAAEISEIFKFRPKSRFWPILASNQPLGTFFSPFRGHRAPKYSQLHKKTLEALWGFGAGRIFSATPPHPTPIFGHRNFCTKKANFGPKWGGEEISVAENTGFGCGVAENFSARTENTLKCFPKKF